VTTRTERAIAIGKDLVLFLGGLAGIFYQQLTGNVNFVFLAIFTAMTGVPGLTNLISILRGPVIGSESQSQAQQPLESESGNST